LVPVTEDTKGVEDDYSSESRSSEIADEQTDASDARDSDTAKNQLSDAEDDKPLYKEEQRGKNLGTDNPLSEAQTTQSSGPMPSEHQHSNNPTESRSIPSEKPSSFPAPGTASQKKQKLAKKRSSRGSTLGFLGRAAALLLLKVLLSSKQWSTVRTAVVLGTMFPGPQQAAAIAFFQPLALSYAVAPALRRMQPSLWRSIDFWQRVLPIYVAYKMTQKRASRLKAEDALALWEKRHLWGSERIYRLCTELGGAYLKNGIILSTRSDFLPQAWCNRLWDLPHRLRPMPIEEVKATVLECFSMPMESIFLWYDKNPLASATVAQIHKCEMPDGRVVILKVQYTGQERLCQKDFRNLRLLARLLQAMDLRFDLMAIIREYERLVPLEFDFEREARMMTVIRRNLRQANLEHVITVPEIVNDLVARRALVMTYIPGCSFLEQEKIRSWDLDVRTLLENVAAAFGQMILVDGIFHADPHPGNFIVMQDGRIALIDFGQVKRIREFVRRRLCWLYLAIADCDEPLIAARFQELGIRFDSSASFRSNVIWTPLESRPGTIETTPDQSELESLSGSGTGDMRLVRHSSIHSIARMGSFMYTPTDADFALFARYLFDISTLDEIDMNATGSLNPLRFIRFQEYPEDIYFVLRVIRLLRYLADQLNVTMSMAEIFATYAARGIRKVAQASINSGGALERRSQWSQLRRYQSLSPMKGSRDVSPSSPGERHGTRTSAIRLARAYEDLSGRDARTDRAMSLPNTPLHDSSLKWNASASNISGATPPGGPAS
jgi:aarF domain-containing kinase